MHRRILTALAASSLTFLSHGGTPRADEYRVSGPVVHENLAIYLVHGKSAAGPVPLTLAEALAKSAVKVHETGNVNELQIENLGNDEVFVQSGDIVKGGQQDRVLTVSLILPQKSGRIPIASFCVEQGRWSARGKEDVKTFATASAAIPSREAKIAMRAPVIAAAPTAYADPTAGIRGGQVSAARAASDTGDRQQEVWRKVRKVQDGLSASLGVPVNAAASQSSLQLALENEKLKDAQAAYLTALQRAGEKEDVVGYIFAVNGKLNSAEVYPSNGLFRKMWPKLLQASVTEAIGHKNADSDPAPSSAVAMAFLDEGAKGKASEKPLPAAVQLEVRDGDKALYFETRRAGGAWVHRSYLAK
ncbi:MAG: hypothetical protein QOF14_713 [Hyphomicrobiales bacterium]|jgi:hypothetical protein|nr:hypothetical protein [Hyphomicrobiales bacterium]